MIVLLFFSYFFSSSSSYLRMTVVGPEKIDAHSHVELGRDGVERVQIFLGLQPAIAPDYQLCDFASDLEVPLLQNSKQLCPCAGGEVVVVGMGRETIDEEMCSLMEDVEAKIANLQQIRVSKSASSSSPLFCFC